MLRVRRVVDRLLLRRSRRVLPHEREEILRGEYRDGRRARHVLPHDRPHHVRLALLRRGDLRRDVPTVTTVTAVVERDLVVAEPPSPEVKVAVARVVVRLEVVPRLADAAAVPPPPRARRPRPSLDVLDAVRRGRGERGVELPVADHPKDELRVPIPSRRVRLVPRPSRGPLRPAELAAVVRHPLYAQPQDPELFEHGRDARRDHPEILPAHELPGARHQRRQRPPRVLPPRRVLPRVEVVVVQPRERVSRPVVEIAETRRLFEFDPRVKRVRVVRVAEQDDVLQERHQAASQLLRLLHEPIRGPVADAQRLRAQEPSLGVVLLPELVRRRRGAVRLRLSAGLFEEPPRGFAVAVAEERSQPLGRHPRLAQAVDEPQPSLVELAFPNRHGRTKPSEATRFRVRGELPDPEETQHVVDPHRAEKTLQVRHPAPPPRVVVLAHLLPIVRGETPVLAVRVEVIRRSPRARVHPEQFRVHPRVHGRLIHADGQVALQHDAPRRRVRSRPAQLPVEVVLHVVVHRHDVVQLAVRLRQTRDDRGRVRRGQVAPPPVLRGPEELPQRAEHRVGFQPRRLLADEALARLGRQKRRPRRLEAPLRDHQLHAHRRLVVDLFEIERVLRAIHLRAERHQTAGVGARRRRISRLLYERLELQVQRVQRVHGDAAVRVRVPPRVVHGRVVHRQELHDAHPRLRGDVHERFQVAEIARADALSRSQGEHRHGDAAAAPRARVPEVPVPDDDPRRRLRASRAEDARGRLGARRVVVRRRLGRRRRLRGGRELARRRHLGLVVRRSRGGMHGRAVRVKGGSVAPVHLQHRGRAAPVVFPSRASVV
eukprot:31516-Pelagococcus_subviridis.AAC.5